MQVRPSNAIKDFSRYMNTNSLSNFNSANCITSDKGFIAGKTNSETIQGRHKMYLNQVNIPTTGYQINNKKTEQ